MNDGVREEFGKHAVRMANLESQMVKLIGQMDQLRKDQDQDERIQQGLHDEIEVTREEAGAMEALQVLLQRMTRLMGRDRAKPRREPPRGPGERG